MKLTIGQPGDKYEQEADQMAADVVQRISTPESESVQRQTPKDDKNLLQAKPMVQSLSGSPLVQLMKIRETEKSAELSPDTAKKHALPLSEQKESALANYTSTTFVTEAKAITDVVDANNHNFTELANEASSKHDIYGDVKIYQWNKTEGVGKDKPVEKTIDGVATKCEIKVKKGGDDKIKVTHFQKI